MAYPAEMPSSAPLSALRSRAGRVLVAGPTVAVPEDLLVFQEQVLVAVGEIAGADGDDVRPLRDHVQELGSGVGRIHLVHDQRVLVPGLRRDGLDPLDEGLVVGAVVPGALGDHRDPYRAVSVEVRHTPVPAQALRRIRPRHRHRPTPPVRSISDRTAARRRVPSYSPPRVVDRLAKPPDHLSRIRRPPNVAPEADTRRSRRHHRGGVVDRLVLAFLFRAAQHE